MVVDSTGLKVFGEREWKVRQHGYSKRLASCYRNSLNFNNIASVRSNLRSRWVS